MLPKRYPRHIEEMMATIVDQAAQWLDIVSSSNARLETTFQKLNWQTTIPKKEPNYSTFDTNTDITETTTKVIIETTSPITDIIKHDNTMATYFPESASYTSKPDQIISKDIVNQNTSSTINITTTVIKTNTEVTTYTPPLLPPITQREMVTFYSTNLHQTCDFSTMEDKLEAKRIQSSPSLFITLGFRCAKTYHPGHECYPPKFVLLEFEDNPPWEPRDLRYKSMILEDKDRFQEGSIDTCLKLKTKSKLNMGLNLSHNHLSGSIPDSVGNMKVIISLDFSDNQLSGMIPPSLAALNFLSHLNLSHNNLSGRIPTGNQLQTLIDPSIYAGNRDLCGTPWKRVVLVMKIQ
ncbi:leucine-rich repeat protein [Tanacetum coccineum]|uniref:Leucine-rich repeat protein n=1 Tax=Tanacetum coccineum TaxID=301880 RepID=A0ABQ4WQJ5_9ASTR